MCDKGETRTVTWFEDCPELSGVGRKCSQDQECQRQGWKLLLLVVGYFLWPTWVDVGPKYCTDCPKKVPGQPLPKAYVHSPAGGLIWGLGPASGPGVVGRLPFDWLGPMPPVGTTYRLPEYIELDAERCEILLDLMQKALDQLKASGRLGEAQTQEDAIKDLKQKCKEYFH